MAEARRKRVRLMLPTDVVVAAQIHPRSQRQVVPLGEVPKDWIVRRHRPADAGGLHRAPRARPGPSSGMDRWASSRSPRSPRHQRHGPLPGGAQRQGGRHHRRRRRLGGGGRAARPGRPDEPRQHRRRRVAGVRGGQDSCPASWRCSMRIRRRRPSRTAGAGHDQAAPACSQRPRSASRRPGRADDHPDRGRRRARGPGLARQPDGRGRGPPGRRRDRARRSCRPAPPPAPTRRSSCATATRQRYGGKGVLDAVATSTTSSGRSCWASTRVDQVSVDRLLIDLDGTPNKGRLGRQRPAGRVAGRGACGRRWRWCCRCIGTWAAPARACCRCRW